MSHTPGPWETGPPHVIRRQYRDEQGRRVTQFIAQMCIPAGKCPDDVSHDAKLMSAAPDMLEALMVLDAYLYATAPESNERQIVIAAIAKAQG